jgi:hypothetical protein
MAAAIPSTEPTSITAGDSAAWTRSLADYSASDGWTLSYAFIKVKVPAAPLLITATASGSDFLVSLTPADTQFWPDGEYNGQGYVTKAGERHTVWTGSLEVMPDYVTAGAVETRSVARRILDFIEASFEKIVQKQVVEATIEGVQLRFRTLKELQEARDYWLDKVLAEDAVATGGGPRRCILTRFTTPQ